MTMKLETIVVLVLAVLMLGLLTVLFTLPRGARAALMLKVPAPYGVVASSTPRLIKTK